MIFNAISYIWNEEDILYASISNAFAQGCDNVFIIDNGSSDKSIEIAKSAGAKLACSFTSKYFDEREKVAHLNAFVQYYNSLHFDSEIWWMYFDADEIMTTNTELSIRETIEYCQANSVLALKGFFYDHIPTHEPYNIPKYNPIDFMPLCSISDTYKIPVVKYEAGKRHIFSAGGAHEIDTGGETYPIAENAVVIHHFQYRNPSATLKRLKTLLRRLYWMDRRSLFLYNNRKSMYHFRYETMAQHYKDNKYSIFTFNTLPYDFSAVKRWYATDSYFQFEYERDEDTLLASAFFYFFLKKFDYALCRFNDLLSIHKFDTYTPYIMIKIAECFMNTDKNSADEIFSYIKKSDPELLSSYIDKNKSINQNKKIKVIPYTSKFSIDKDAIYKRMDEIVQKNNNFSSIF